PAAAASREDPPLPQEPSADLTVPPVLPPAITEADSIRIRTAMRHTMTEHAGIVRTDRGLQEAIVDLAALLRDYQTLPAAPFSQHARETCNLLQCAISVAQGALARRENVGLHYNADLA
ncbi:MAG: hypothetical protein C4321_10350, partial [Chloroflexota bacterium]